MRFDLPLRFLAGCSLVLGLCPFPTPSVVLPSLEFHDDFQAENLAAWQFPHPEDWEILSQGGNHFLHMKRSRDPGVPRRPLQFALLKKAGVGSFDFQMRMRREGRSMIVVFNYVDTLHFYYAHLSGDRGVDQPVHNGIFIVNGEPRKRIAGVEAPPALPDREWHSVRLVRDSSSGSIQVFVDRQKTPLFSVVDRTFPCGQVGIGSFDETGDFDDVELRSDEGACVPGSPLRPAEAVGRDSAERFGASSEGRRACLLPGADGQSRTQLWAAPRFYLHP